jgi:guanylate kinase
MKNRLTKRQKEIEAHRAIKKHILTTFLSDVLKDLESVINDGETPEDWFNLGDNRLKDYIIKKYCLNWDEFKK